MKLGPGGRFSYTRATPWTHAWNWTGQTSWNLAPTLVSRCVPRSHGRGSPGVHRSSCPVKVPLTTDRSTTVSRWRSYRKHEGRLYLIKESGCHGNCEVNERGIDSAHLNSGQPLTKHLLPCNTGPVPTSVSVTFPPSSSCAYQLWIYPPFYPTDHRHQVSLCARDTRSTYIMDVVHLDRDGDFSEAAFLRRRTCFNASEIPRLWMLSNDNHRGRVGLDVGSRWRGGGRCLVACFEVICLRDPSGFLFLLTLCLSTLISKMSLGEW